jgi:hypothetical protein
MLGERGLTAIKSADLKLILKAIYREELSCPISQVGLATVGLLRLGDDIDTLRGLEESAVRAVIVAVLAERG